jgi:hypothetical protein
VIILTDNKLFKFIAVVFFVLLALFVFSITLDDFTRKTLLSEDGPVEIASAALYFVCCVYALVRGGGVFLKKYPYFIVIPLLFGMRELDFDKRFTTIGVLKSKFYVSPLEPWHTKLIVIALGLAVIVLMVMMVKTHLKGLWESVRSGGALGWGVVLVLTMLVVSKSLDGLERKCLSIGLSVAPLLAKYSSVAEEIIELGIPVMMLLLFSHYFSQMEQSTSQQ